MLQLKWIVSLVLIGSLAACNDVRQTADVQQPKSAPLTAGIGDTVITIHEKKNLPNAFGKADIFGRTTPTGIITVQFLGVDQSKVRFVRSGAVIDTGATTMNSTPIVIPNTSTTTTRGMVGTTPVTATSTTQGTPTVIQPKTPQATVVPQANIQFDVDLTQQRSFEVAGQRVVIIDATASRLTYRIE